MTRELVNKKGILLVEWVSLDHLKSKEERLAIEDLIRQAVEYVIPQPGNRQPPVPNTPWPKSKKKGG